MQLDAIWVDSEQCTYCRLILEGRDVGGIETRLQGKKFVQPGTIPRRKSTVNLACGLEKRIYIEGFPCLVVIRVGECRVQKVCEGLDMLLK